MKDFEIVFWKTGVKDFYYKAIDKLIEYGFSRENAIDFLEELYHKTGEEYGA